MEQEVVKKSDYTPAVTTTLPSEHELMVFHTMAEQAVSSKMYRGIGDKSGVMMIMLAARELSIPPMQALNGGINIINGKVEISTRMMNALIRKAGHKITIDEISDSHCILTGKRCDTGETVFTSFSVAEAQKAGLLKPGSGWSKFPKDMCFARALSRLARQLFSDVIGIGYVEGEIKPIDHEISMPEEAQKETVEEESEAVAKFLENFDHEDKHFAIEYLRVVKKHFDWTTKHAVEELTKDKEKLFEKFSTWKEKTQLKETG